MLFFGKVFGDGKHETETGIVTWLATISLQPEIINSILYSLGMPILIVV